MQGLLRTHLPHLLPQISDTPKLNTIPAIRACFLSINLSSKQNNYFKACRSTIRGFINANLNPNPSHMTARIGLLNRRIIDTLGLPFLQRVSIACYAERCISYDRFCPTV